MRCSIWTAFTSRIWVAAAAEYQGYHKSELMCQRYADAYARGAYFSKLGKVFESLASMQTLDKAGLLVSLENKRMKAALQSKSSPVYAAEHKKSALAFKIVAECMRWRSLTHMHYTSSLPGKFGGLLPGFNNEDALQYCHLAYRTMCKFETWRHVFKECSKLWRAVPFLENEVVREALTMMSEFSFKYVPPHVEAMARTLAAWGSSLVTELGNREIRSRLTDAAKNKIKEQTMWKSLVDSTVLNDFGRTTASAVVAGVTPFPPLPKSAYHALGGEPSLNAPADPKLDDIKKPAGQTWKPVNSLSKNFIPAAWSLMLEVTKNPKLREDLPMAWSAILAVKFDVLMHLSSQATFWVLEASQYGFLGWECKLLAVKGSARRCMQLSGSQPHWCHLVDPSAWGCWPLRLEPPVYEVASGRVPAIGMHIDACDPMPLLERAARCGFHHVPAPFLERLFRMHVRLTELKIERPKLAFERLVLLITQVVPAMTEADLNQAMLARVGEVDSAPLVDGNSELAEAMVDPQEKKELREYGDKLQREAALRKQVEDDIKAGSKFLEMLGYGTPKLPATVTTTPAPKEKQKVDWKKVAALDSPSTLKGLVPKVAGCSLQSILPKKCYTAFYPGALPHASRTRTYGMAFSKVAVLKHCVRWAWQEHFKATSTECPFVL